MKKRWIPFITIATMLSISSLATADETEMDLYIAEDDSEELLVVAADEDEDILFEESGLIEDLEAADGDVEGVPIDEVHFPDPDFRDYISASFDKPDIEEYKDGVLSAEEIAAATELDIYGYNISDLSGIGYLKSLKTISCAESRILKLDVSESTSVEEIHAEDSKFESIDLTGCISLEKLDVHNCPISSLDLSSCSNLTYLDCSDCGPITSLDVSCCRKLTYLGCNGLMLTSLDVSMCPELRTLHCIGQYKKLKSLNISNCNYLETCLFNYTSYHRDSFWDEDLGEILFDFYMFLNGDTKYDLTFDPTAAIITSRGTFPAYSTPETIKKALNPAPTPAPTPTPTSAVSEQITIPKKPIIKKPSAIKNKITVNWSHFKQSKKTKAVWKKIKKVQVQCATDKGFTNIVKSTMVGKKKKKAVIKGLAKKTTYYVRVRYFDGTGYSAWSGVKKIKTKK